MGKLFYLDVETGGFNAKKDALLQIGGIIDIGGVVVEKIDLKMRPFDGDRVKEEALKIQGRTLEEVQSYPNPLESFAELMEIMHKYVNPYESRDKFFFLGYNSPFDNQFVREFFKKIGDPYFGSWFHAPDICVMRSAQDVLRAERSMMDDFKLMTVARYLGVEIDEEQAHDGYYDCVITRQIHQIINRRKGEDGIVS